MKTLNPKIAGLIAKSKYFGMVALMLLLSSKGFSQDPGGNPDGPPPAVPLNDYYLEIMLIAVGAVLAFFVFRKMQRKQAIN